MEFLGDLVFVVVVYLITAIPCFIVIGLGYFLLKKLATNYRAACLIFTSLFGLLLFPTLMPAASIMQLPGPGGYVLIDVLILGDAFYLTKHFAEYPIFTWLSLLLTFGIGFFISRKMFIPNKTIESSE